MNESDIRKREVNVSLVLAFVTKCTQPQASLIEKIAPTTEYLQNFSFRYIHKYCFLLKFPYKKHFLHWRKIKLKPVIGNDFHKYYV